MSFEPGEEMMFPENLKYAVEIVVPYIWRSRQMGNPVLAGICESVRR